MTNLLSIYWRDPQKDMLEWCLSSEAGLLSGGTATIEELARQQAANGDRQIELWIGGEDVLCFAVAVPTKRRSLLKSAAPYLAEEYLAQDVEQMHLAIGERSEEGLLEVCLLDQARFADMIGRLGEHELAPDRSLPDYIGVSAASDEAVIIMDPVADRGLLRVGKLFASQLAGFAGSLTWLTMALDAHDLGQLDKPSLHLIGDIDAEQVESMQKHLGKWHIQHRQTPKDMDHKLLVGQLHGRSLKSPINFSSGLYKRKRKTSFDFSIFRSVMRAAAVFAVVLIASVFIKTVGLWLHSYTLKAESRQLYQTAFLDRALSNLEIDSRLETISIQRGETGIADFLYLFGVLSEAVGSLKDPNFNLGSVQYSYGGANLAVSLILSDLESLDRLTKALTTAGLVVGIASAQQGKGGFMQAQISLTSG